MGMFDNYEFRCSSLGKIHSSDGTLTQTNKTFLIELFVQEVDGIRKDISSKYFEKGTFNEVDGVQLINEALYPDHFLTKNTERKGNGWINGECDVLPPDDIIYDVKNAWDKITFAKAKLSIDYELQGRGYMWLWGKPTFRLFYCLTNMPEHMLCDEEKKIFFSHSFVTMEDEEYLKLCMELRRKHNYDDMELWKRFKIWEIEHSDDKIEELKKKITKCRKFLNQLWEDRISSYKLNKELMGIIDPSILIASPGDGVTLVEPPK